MKARKLIELIEKDEFITVGWDQYLNSMDYHRVSTGPSIDYYRDAVNNKIVIHANGDWTHYDDNKNVTSKGNGLEELKSHLITYHEKEY